MSENKLSFMMNIIKTIGLLGPESYKYIQQNINNCNRLDFLKNLYFKTY